MNINLVAASNKQQQKNQKSGELNYGLNSRRRTEKNHQQSNSVFDNDGDSSSLSDDDDGAGNKSADRRGLVNKQLRKEQEALRKRAKAAVYDFDGTYDDDDNKRATLTSSEKPDTSRESRYMSELLQNAKRRKIERDAIYERKLAKEQQQEEELNPEYMGKERFMTSAYKRKLVEREELAKEQEAQDKTDVYHSNQQEDSNKGMAMANFYSNLNRHGGGSSESRYGVSSSSSKHEVIVRGSNKEHQKGRNESYTGQKDGAQPSFLDGFEAAAPKPGLRDGFEASKSVEQQDDGKPTRKPPQDVLPPMKTMRQIREEKVAQARKRYLQRRGMTEEEASRERIK